VKGINQLSCAMADDGAREHHALLARSPWFVVSRQLSVIRIQ
jgi:hypothetical protein